MFDRIWKKWFFGILVACVLAWVVLPLKPFDECIDQRQKADAYQALREIEFSIIKARLSVRLRLACAVDAADKYQGALLVLSGVAVALFTFALWISTHRLWRAGTEQITTAATAADAALKSAETAERALTHTERAFVYPIDTQFDSHSDPADGKIWWSFKIKWQNSGKTPTRNLRIWTQSLITDEPMAIDYAFLPKQGRNIQTMLGPNGIMFGDAVIFTSEEISLAQSKKKHIYLWGWAKYFDVFEKTPEHETRFCYKILTLGDPSIHFGMTNSLDLITAHHPRHNCADEDCREQDGNPIRRTI